MVAVPGQALRAATPADDCRYSSRGGSKGRDVARLKPSKVFQMPAIAVSDTTLSRREIDFFVDNGFLVKKRLLDSNLVHAAMDRIWSHLLAHVPMDAAAVSLNRDAPCTWRDPAWGPMSKADEAAPVSKVASGSVRTRRWDREHLRVVPDPVPPWFSRPHAIDCLIYLDDLNDSTGALAVVPGSHHWLDREPPPLRYEPIPAEQTAAPAGWQHGDHPLQSHAPGVGHARRQAPHAHPRVHAVLVARVAARRRRRPPMVLPGTCLPTAMRKYASCLVWRGTRNRPWPLLRLRTDARRMEISRRFGTTSPATTLTMNPVAPMLRA